MFKRLVSVSVLVLSLVASNTMACAHHTKRIMYIYPFPMQQVVVKRMVVMHPYGFQPAYVRVVRFEPQARWGRAHRYHTWTQYHRHHI